MADENHTTRAPSANSEAEPPPIPKRKGYGAGAYRRSIRLEAAAGRVEAELADDFHHFSVSLQHDGERIVEIEAKDIRVPWTSCPGAVAPIRALLGEPLTQDLHATLRATDGRSQCTHILDLATLAVAHAARSVAGGAAERHYAAWLPDRVEGLTRPHLEIDGVTVLRWTLRGAKVVESEPERFVGLGLQGRGFIRFLLRDLADEPELAEALSVFRKAVFIGMGRQYDFDSIAKASTFARVVGTACHTFHPDRVDAARRVVGSVRDFSDPASDPLAGAD
jgi:hypothetical protein